MKQLLLFFALAITGSLTVFAQEFEFDYNQDYPKILDQTKDETSPLYYSALLARFQANDVTLTDFEVLALLIGFTDTKHFKPYRYLSIERKIYSLNGNGRFEEALTMCDSLLHYVPVSQQALIEKSYSLHKLGQEDSAQYYLWQFRKIMDAMARSGDGLTPETAFFSLGPADGQNFIQKYLSGEIGMMGSTLDENKNFIDILEIVLEDETSHEKQRRNLYFQIEHAKKTMFDGVDIKELQDTLELYEKEKE